jgi:peptidoglycan/LPS O-acetylase OafA/YrhL
MSHQKRLEWLDCLRGYAIAAVVLVHLGLFPAGGRGVQLFFVASAISLMYAHAVHGEEGASAFFVRRLFRIMPMLWLAVLLFYVLDLVTTGQTPSKWQIISTVTLLPSNASFAFQDIAVPGSWSIVCEASFNVLFPIAVDLSPPLAGRRFCCLRQSYSPPRAGLSSFAMDSGRALKRYLSRITSPFFPHRRNFPASRLAL